VTEPEVVLADEPTGNLDSKNGAVIMSLLRRSCDELGQAIVVVTHDPRAATYADRVLFLKDGQVVERLAYGGVDIPARRLRIVMHAMGILEL
jgi:putative ABC transport system ATP-binding protein